jgi:hypothetical protein
MLTLEYATISKKQGSSNYIANSVHAHIFETLIMTKELGSSNPNIEAGQSSANHSERLDHGNPFDNLIYPNRNNRRLEIR